jgi:hypothetical protein
MKRRRKLLEICAESPASGAPQQEKNSCKIAETGDIGEVYCKMADEKPNKSNGEQRLPRCTVVANHNDVNTGGAISDPDEEAITRK